MERILAANPWLQDSGYSTVMSLPQVTLETNESWSGYRLSDFTCPELQALRLECPDRGSKGQKGALRNILLSVSVSVVLVLIMASVLVCAARRLRRQRAMDRRKDWEEHAISGGKVLGRNENSRGDTCDAVSEPQLQAGEGWLPFTIVPDEVVDSDANRCKLLSDPSPGEQRVLSQVWPALFTLSW